MTKNKPILTIAIPTYNRHEKLQKQLAIIIPQLNSNVCLTIHDNNSTTPINDIIPKHTEHNIKIYRNEVNIGGDANIARCFEYCNTNWLWTVSDDDYLTNNAIKIVLSFIKKNPEATFINLNTNKNKITYGFYEYIKELDMPFYLSDAYWITKCIYNINNLKPHLIFYYQNLSCMIGQLVLILKYLEITPEGKCITNKCRIIEHNDDEFGWNLLEYIKRTNVIFEIFKFEDKKILQSNILKAIIKLYYNFLKYDYTRIKNKELLYYLKLIIFKAGILNTIKYNLINFLTILTYIILPKKIALLIKKLFKQLINATKNT